MLSNFINFLIIFSPINVERISVVSSWSSSDSISETNKSLETSGQKVIKSELVQKPINYVLISDPDSAKKALSFLEKIEDNNDVYRVFANIDIPDEVYSKIQKNE